jgi:hypothetical protein
MLRSVTDVPVRLKIADLAAASRTTDGPAFYAGGLMYRGGPCSSGFAVRIGGQSYVSTARHCTNSPYENYAGTASYGSEYGTTEFSGAAILDSRGSGRTFGGWIGSSSTMAVAGVQDVWYGDYVCTSGGNSGEHCGIWIADSYKLFSGHLWNDGLGSGIETLEGYQSGTGIAVARGDSGGPVITYRSDGKVNAVGMIQAVGSSVACPTLNSVSSDTTCSKWVYFSRTSTLLQEVNGSLVTG